MKINVYGSRGSIARSHPDLHRYGGNTCCIEVLSDSGTRIVLDMGSGAYDLGQKLAEMGPLQNQHILLSHTHYDHIQGFPFFRPLFIPGSQWNVYAPGGFSSTLKDKLASQMSHEFFPLSIEQLNADINYLDLKEGELDLGDIHVTTQYINHTVLTLGYRLESKTNGTSIAYITDHEMFNHALAHGYNRDHLENLDSSSQRTAVKTPDDRHADFFKGVDLLVHDSQYLASEYHKTEGYGHSTVEYVVDMAMAVGVKRVALFHHDPLRTDDQIDEILKMAQERVKAAGSTLEVVAARDFSTIVLEGSGTYGATSSDVSWTSATKPKVLPGNPRIESAVTKFVASNQEVIISHPNKEMFKELDSDGLMVTHIDRGHPFLQHVPDKKPSLLLVSCDSASEVFVLKNCQRLRQNYGAWGKDVPYIVVVKSQGILEELRDQGDASGVTDWVVEPFSPAYIRTKIRMGISRNPCKWKPPVKPKNEQARMGALRSYQILDSVQEARFDRITKMCAAVFDVPFVFISLVDENRQWFKSAQWLCPGKAPTETSREVSFCGHAINEKDILLIPDASQDDRFADNPLVTDALKIRFYAGYPLSVPNVNDPTGPEYNVGTLCIIDQRPRDLDEAQKDLLREFGEMVKNEMLAYAAQKMNTGYSPLLKFGGASSLSGASQKSAEAGLSSSSSMHSRAA